MSVLKVVSLDTSFYLVTQSSKRNCQPIYLLYTIYCRWQIYILNATCVCSRFGYTLLYVRVLCGAEVFFAYIIHPDTEMYDRTKKTSIVSCTMTGPFYDLTIALCVCTSYIVYYRISFLRRFTYIVRIYESF